MCIGQQVEGAIPVQLLKVADSIEKIPPSLQLAPFSSCMASETLILSSGGRPKTAIKWIEGLEESLELAKAKGETLCVGCVGDGTLLESNIKAFFAYARETFGQDDCFRVKGNYMRTITFCTRLRATYNEIQQMQLLPATNSHFLEWMDGEIRKLLQSWACSFTPRIVPRPNNLGSLARLGDLLELYEDFSLTIPLQLNIPLSDVSAYFGFALVAIVAQINDFMISSISRALERYYLSRNGKAFLSDFWNIVVCAGSKHHKQHCCSGIVRQAVSVCAELQARQGESIECLIRDLKATGSYTVTLETDDMIELTSRTILTDPARKKIFDQSECDRSRWLQDDFIIRICGERTVRVESRNAWSKDKWIAEVSRKYNLLIVDPAQSPNPIFNEWMHNAQLGFHVTSFCMLWGVGILESEGLIREDPRTALTCYNYLCIYILDTLRLFNGQSSVFTSLLWRTASEASARWLRATTFLWSEGLLDEMHDCIIPPMNYLNMLINKCPDMDLLAFDQICAALRDLESLQNEGSLDRRGDAILLQQYLERCIRRCDQRGNVETTCYDSEIKDGIPGLKCPIAIGRGSFGQVYKCFDLALNMAVAVKEIYLTKDADLDRDSLAEANYLQYLNHRHVLEFYGAVLTPKALYLKVELCEGGSLRDLIKTNGPANDLEFRRIALQIALGLAFLHGNHIVHGDLKPGNILRNQFEVFKLADFGAAQSLVKSGGTGNGMVTGTIAYMAPEIIKGGQIGLSSDIWSLGCTLFHLATGIAPWTHYDNLYSIMTAASREQLFDLSPLDSCKVEPRGLDLIRACLKFNPTERPLAVSILLSNYLYDE